MQFILQVGNTALHVASQRGVTSIVESLLDADKSLAAFTNLDSCTALHLAAREGHTEVVELLLKADSKQINCQDSSGWTPLHEAAAMGWEKVIKRLVKVPGINWKLRDLVSLVLVLLLT